MADDHLPHEEKEHLCPQDHEVATGFWRRLTVDLTSRTTSFDTEVVGLLEPTDTVIGEATVPSGWPATVEWTGLTEGETYVWSSTSRTGTARACGTSVASSPRLQPGPTPRRPSSRSRKVPPGPGPDPTDPGPTDPGPTDPDTTDPGPTVPGPVDTEPAGSDLPGDTAEQDEFPRTGTAAMSLALLAVIGAATGVVLLRARRPSLD